MCEDNGILEMSFMPNTIEHLGARLYSTIPPVIAELVANSYDADATEVHVHLQDKDEKRIVVSDNGVGMSFVDINNKFLRIGRNRRLDSDGQVTAKGRKVIGKKGLGKLSFFGIAEQIEVHTVCNGLENSFLLDWNEIMQASKDDDRLKDYHPHIIVKNKATSKCNGTSIILKRIKRKTDFKAENIADSLSRYFILQQDFNILVSRNNEEEIAVTNRRRFELLDVEFQWNVPLDEIKAEYKYKDKIIGEIYTTKKPIPPNTNLRGVSLFSRGKLVNAPEYFSSSTSSHFYSYVTGWLSVDFVDDFDDDVIETNRQSLNWSLPEMEVLREYLQQVMKYVMLDWRNRRKNRRQELIEDKTTVNVTSWLSTMPADLSKQLSSVVDAILGQSEISEFQESAATGIVNLHNIIPEYPYFHWRHLHPTLREEVKSYYCSKDYIHAVTEGVKRYIQEVRNVSGNNTIPKELQLLQKAFSDNDPLIDVVGKRTRCDGTSFSRDTKNDVEKGTRELSTAIWSGFRNPFQHERVVDLLESGLFTEQDCLDILSVLSHLFYRLEGSN